MSKSGETTSASSIATINNNLCRCPALSHLLVGMYKELCAVNDGKPMDEVFPGCQRDNVKCVAASLLALCNVDIPIGISGVY
uniref:Bifunctional inhibitor/plant lipid transfer protein/seed storage helical domain-containing protein n=1 Tax=Oryza meridionalis TaxID=40149 RepID=A0A0E0E944_9ORYZ